MVNSRLATPNRGLAAWKETDHQNMPSLFRFLAVMAVIAAVVYGMIFALANFVTPKSREMTVTVPADKFLKK